MVRTTIASPEPSTLPFHCQTTPSPNTIPLANAFSYIIRSSHSFPGVSVICLHTQIGLPSRQITVGARPTLPLFRHGLPMCNDICPKCVTLMADFITSRCGHRGVARNAPNAVTPMVGYYTHVANGRPQGSPLHHVATPSRWCGGTIVGATFTVALVQRYLPICSDVCPICGHPDDGGLQPPNDMGYAPLRFGRCRQRPYTVTAVATIAAK